jgi:hypothetical protein
MSILQAPTDNNFHPSRATSGSEEIRMFVNTNADELIRIASAAGGHNACAAATDLVETALEFSAPEEHLRDLLIVVRDALSDSPAQARGGSGHARSDLDAAVRWFGARLDDLICE